MAKDRSLKDITTAKYQLTTHKEAVEKDQARIREAATARLQLLRKAVEEQEASMQAQQVADEAVHALIANCQAQLSALCKHVEALPKEADAPPTTASLQPQGTFQDMLGATGLSSDIILALTQAAEAQYKQPSTPPPESPAPATTTGSQQNGGTLGPATSPTPAQKIAEAGPYNTAPPPADKKEKD